MVRLELVARLELVDQPGLGDLLAPEDHQEVGDHLGLVDLVELVDHMAQEDLPEQGDPPALGDLPELVGHIFIYNCNKQFTVPAEKS